MYGKLPKGLLAALTLMACLVSGPTLAAPWMPATDRGLRQDVELIAAYGLVIGPANTWPMSWNQVRSGLSMEEEDSLPPRVLAAYRRIERANLDALEYGRLHHRIDLKGTTDPKLVRSFGDTARTDTDVTVSSEYHGYNTYLNFSASYRDEPNDPNTQFDGTYGALALGNWAVYAGFLDMWWGPGQEGALILGTNARPFFKTGIQRLQPRPFGAKWLSWLGPWNLSAYVGRLEGKRDFKHPLLAGIRFSFQPGRKWEIGLSRSITICGSGRRCGPETWARALIAVGNFDNKRGSEERDPANQLAAFDVRYTTRLGRSVLSVYTEVMGEDEVAEIAGGEGGFGFIIGAWNVTLGTSLTLHDESTGTWKLGLEASDTQANHVFGPGERGRSGITYNHRFYTDGYTYRGRVIGHPIDADSHILTLRLDHSDSKDWRYSIAYRYAVLSNADSVRRVQRISVNKEILNMVEGSVLIPLERFDIFGELRAADDRPNTPFESKFDIDFEVGLRLKF